MKSAYERALERFGGEPIQSLSDEQKEQIAEIEQRYKAKIAAAELAAQERRKKAQSQEELDQVADDLSVELASLREKSEREKDKIRHADG